MEFGCGIVGERQLPYVYTVTRMPCDSEAGAKQDDWEEYDLDPVDIIQAVRKKAAKQKTQDHLRGPPPIHDITAPTKASQPVLVK